MRVTIIADDRMVYVGGEPLIVDMTGLDPTIQAIQWYDTVGEIEYRYDAITHTRKPNDRITDLSPFQVFVDRWTAASNALAATVGPMNVIG
jgi:hypothetical protein